VADSLIFLYVGFSIASHELNWQTAFVAWTTILCICSRFVFVFMASFLANYFLWTSQKITLGMMFFISYGGFKGSVAHALVEIVSNETASAIGIPLPVMRCTVVFINLFYVLFIGLTMTPLLRIYKFLSSEPVRLSLFETLNGRVITSACHAMSDIVGYHHSALQAKLEELYRRYFRPLLLRDPNKHDEIADVYADIALALHHASVARDRSSVQFHLRQLRPQLKKAFYLQQQGVFKPLHHVSLHHIDFISEPTDMSAGGQNDLSLARPTPTHAPAFSYETSRGISSPESTEWEEAQEESYHDALCEKEVIVNSIQQPRGTKRNVTRHSWKQKACCTSKANLESPEPETNSADEVPEGDVGATDDCRGGGGGGVRAGDEEEGLFRQILSRHNRHTYVFDETAYAERVQQSIQSKHRALKLHHFHKT
uniref:Na_H_Exchanger domain-containing protein n=1 Tax=Mesocestoides corti TaxID=53468 RepID=A0A5K3EPE1_MESCO